jgi:hypothetical protein
MARGALASSACPSARRIGEDLWPNDERCARARARGGADDHDRTPR